MKRDSIVYKLFGISLLVFTVLLGYNSFIQKLFLEQYYIKRKIEIVRNDIEIFGVDYLKENWTVKETVEKIDFFIQKNHSPIIMVDETGKPRHNNKYNDILIIRTKAGEFYTVELSQLMEMINFIPKIGDRVQIDGTVFEDEKRFRDVFKIDSNGRKYYDKELIKVVHEDMRKNKFPVNLNIIEVRGEIVYINDGAGVDYRENKYMAYKSSFLMMEIKNIFSENKFSINEIQDDSILNYEYIDPNTDNKNMIFIKPLIKDNEKKLFIFVITSFQPINEAVDIIGEFNVYVFLFAIVLIAFLSFIYSKMIAKPLLKINQAAERMANLDFSAKCEINSKDELGNLSKNINTMAANLSSSLEGLKSANEKLVDDIERDRRQEQKRRQFITDISHELKTPLGIMKGFAEGIKEDIYEVKKDYYLDVIIDEIGKMDSLVLDMLTISRLQAVGYKLSMQEFYIDDLINSLVEKYIHIFDEKELRLSYLSGHFKVYGDKTKINRVIDNLLSNGVKYSEKGSKVNISVQELEESVYFYIENTGVHILEVEIDRLWDRFYRVENSRNRLFGGTGLGLSIVKSILELHKSDYGVRNTKEGVEFYFSLSKAE